MADTKVFLSGNRIQGRSDDFTLASIPQTSWKELDRVTLSSSTSSNMDTGTFAAKDNLMFLVHASDSSTNSDLQFTFNSDTGSNYSGRTSDDGANDTTLTSQNALRIGVITNDPSFCVGYIRNTASQEKLLIGNGMYATAGASNVPHRKEEVGKWANTSDQITSVQLRLEGNNIQSPAELVVLGCDDDEADSGTNFWQELADVDLSSGAATTLSTGTITAKKYLWVQGYSERNTSGTHQPMVTFNDDAGSNYAVRRCNNGGSTGGGGEDAEQAWGSQSKGIFAWRAGNKHYTNSYIFNTSSIEALMMIDDTAFTTAGASDGSPYRSENLTKWANTSDQITSIKLSEQDGHTFDTQTSLRVWGSD